ncbi:wall-associated receptor kinase-like 14 [Salvia miltiorrhiza]|uniref:wall-associated receptor kinase-like 14 n=1 Tax=Salvia miltiorrhiza TaxID=226208 RepID=UPI0025AC8727|nr:wall-associated receptor kinase-like 14 [Salvia miltiorrhiza]
MKLKSSTPILFFAVSLLLWPSREAAVAVAASRCNQTCGGTTLPFPFGFSGGCPIQLNCSSSGTALAADFPVLSTTSDTILVSLPAVCDRPVEALGHLFTRNYAPTFLNAVLLQNCSGGPNSCFIPTTAVKANFELLDCGHTNDSIRCYSETDNASLFMDYGKLRRSGCQSLFSAISIESLDMSLTVSLDVRIVRLGWWVLGSCGCSDHAKCTGVLPPLDGEPPAYRCRCVDGFVGDGFRDGVGCRKEAQRCNLSKYISGQCRGAARILVLIGGATAAVTVIAVVAVTSRFLVKRSKVRSRSRRHRSRRLTETAGIAIPVYHYKEMEKATNFFSEKKMLGTGAYGTVYSGKLSNDKWVAIKKLKHGGSSSSEHVINEIKLLASVSHPNLVQLLGCSMEDEEILVYEFMPNGTLCQHLQGEKGGGLAWPVRLSIALETAKALSYLHHTLHPPIYHRDVKSSNILLDYNYTAKVADFGLSRLGMAAGADLSHVSTAPQGTPGYVDPQYHQHFHLSDKSDVYSFGVVLVEIITALRVVDFSRPPGEINLAALAVDRIGRGCLEEIIDPFILKLDGGDWTLSSVHKVAELAFRCLAFDRDLRPSMMEVVVELEQIAASKWTKSASSSSNLMIKEDEELCKVSSRDFSPAASVHHSWGSDETSPSSK